MASLTITNARKSYGKQNVIKDVSLEIPHGELVIFVGPSGCGKSTLLRAIAGLDQLDSGDIHIGEACVNDRLPRDRDIAMVFQSYALYPHMTVADNMSFALRMAGADRDTRAAAVKNAAEILSLGHLLDRFPRQLSGGQRQRVAMGRAIVRNPAVFLFDEPLSNLDAQLRVQMRSEIKQLHHRLGSTIVYVTHDQIEAMTLADRIVCLNGGVVAQQGTPDDLYTRPANEFVARFIGSPSMTIFDGKTVEHGVSCPDGVIRAIAGAEMQAKGRDIHIGLRPEHLTEVNSPGALPFTLPITLIEPLGSDTLVHLTFGPTSLLARVQPAFGRSLHIGQSVTLFASPDAFHLFDADTGIRI